MTDALNLRDRVALVTGASRGIGRAIADLFRELGATVIVNYRDANERPAPGDGPAEDALMADVAVPAATSRMLENVTERFGHLDILVNNAGIYPRASVERLTPELWDDVQAVNLRGAFFCTQAALPLLKASRHARVVNIASVASVSGPVEGAHYAASKAGLVAMTQSLARALGPDQILVNAIAPGLTDTAQPTHTARERELFGQGLPLRRIAQPLDVARVAAFFASDLAAYVTGQVLYLHGGEMRTV